MTGGDLLMTLLASLSIAMWLRRTRTLHRGQDRRSGSDRVLLALEPTKTSPRHESAQVAKCINALIVRIVRTRSLTGRAPHATLSGAVRIARTASRAQFLQQLNHDRTTEPCRVSRCVTSRAAGTSCCIHGGRARPGDLLCDGDVAQTIGHISRTLAGRPPPARSMQCTSRFGSGAACSLPRAPNSKLPHFRWRRHACASRAHPADSRSHDVVCRRS